MVFNQRENRTSTVINNKVFENSVYNVKLSFAEIILQNIVMTLYMNKL